MSRRRLERELEELSKLVTTLALAREKNGGQGEKKKEGGEEEKEGGEEVVPDKMGIDKKVKEKKCDRDLKSWPQISFASETTPRTMFGGVGANLT